MARFVQEPIIQPVFEDRTFHWEWYFEALHLFAFKIAQDSGQSNVPYPTGPQDYSNNHGYYQQPPHGNPYVPPSGYGTQSSPYPSQTAYGASNYAPQYMPQNYPTPNYYQQTQPYPGYPPQPQSYYPPPQGEYLGYGPPLGYQGQNSYTLQPSSYPQYPGYPPTIQTNYGAEPYPSANTTPYPNTGFYDNKNMPVAHDKTAKSTKHDQYTTAIKAGHLQSSAPPLDSMEKQSLNDFLNDDIEINKLPIVNTMYTREPINESTIVASNYKRTALASGTGYIPIGWNI